MQGEMSQQEMQKKKKMGTEKKHSTSWRHFTSGTTGSRFDPQVSN